MAPVGVLILIAIGGSAVQHLWNWLLPTLFALPQIGFWQALGLLALCRILFGGFGHHRGTHRPNFRRRMTERWSKMTPETQAGSTGPSIL